MARCSEGELLLRLCYARTSRTPFCRKAWHAIGTAYIPASLHRSVDQADLPTRPATVVFGHGRAAHDHGAAGDRPRRHRDDAPLALALLGGATCSGQNAGLFGRGSNALIGACLARCTAAFQT